MFLKGIGGMFDYREVSVFLLIEDDDCLLEKIYCLYKVSYFDLIVCFIV